MGLPKRKIQFSLWDGFIKPIDWYFSDDGKRAFYSAFEHAEEMIAEIEKSNWISIVFNVCYQSTKKPVSQKKNWLIKYFYEYMLSRYSIKMASNEHTLVLITLLSIKYPYPDCLDEDKHPLLYFFSRVKQILPEGYSEQAYPILKDIAHYIYDVFVNLNKDVSRDSRIYDKEFYVDYRDKPQKYNTVLQKLEELAEFPEYLRRN